MPDSGSEPHPLIRPATTADAATLAAFARRTFVETFGNDTSAEDMALYVDASFGPAIQATEIADPLCVTLLASIDDRLAGYAQLTLGHVPACVLERCPDEDRIIELKRFYVDRAWHGRGVAPALMRAADAEVLALGRDVVWLGVWEHNHRALAFYQRCGYVDVGAHTFVLGRDAQTDRIMSRTLGRAAPGSIEGCGLRASGSGRKVLPEAWSLEPGAA